jgi:nucleoside-diphosphate-sugar epimerase
MKVLFIGGTGTISSACVAAAVEHGYAVTLLNRGESSLRPAPAGVEIVRADIHDPDSVRAALGEREFDVVANFIAYAPETVERDIERFRGRTGQYVFISSCAVYEAPAKRLPVVESAARRSPWSYAQAKIAGEELLNRAYREEGFPATIVRPFHTYDHAMVPISLAPGGDWTVIDRMRRGAPIPVCGDGTSVWALLHNTDFAKAFVGLLGRPEAVGESFHITSEEVLTWNQVHELLAAAAGVEPNLVHLASEAIARIEPELGALMLYSISQSLYFDNSKVRALVPGWGTTVQFATGAREIVEWYDAHPERRVVNEQADALFDRFVAVAQAAGA